MGAGRSPATGPPLGGEAVVGAPPERGLREAVGVGLFISDVNGSTAGQKSTDLEQYY